MQFNTVLVALSGAALIIGIHQSLFYGFFQSYWLFMTAALLFLWYQVRKGKERKKSEPNTKQPQAKKLSSKKAKKRR